MTCSIRMSENGSSLTRTGRKVTGPPTSGSNVRRSRVDNTGPAPMIQTESNFVRAFTNRLKLFSPGRPRTA
jgi:hypothetical protein